jgi:hypothetical protein
LSYLDLLKSQWQPKIPSTPWQLPITATMLLPCQEGRHLARINLAMTIPWQAINLETMTLLRALITSWQALIMRLMEVDEVDALGSHRQKNCKCRFFIKFTCFVFNTIKLNVFSFSPLFNLTILGFNIFKLNVFGRRFSLNLDIIKLNLFDGIQSGQHQIECV